MVSESEQTLK